MNINFAFGEHFYEGGDSSFWLDLTVSLIGAAIGAGLGYYFAFRIFSIETLRDKTKEQQTRFIDSHNIIKYFQILLDSIIIYYEGKYMPIVKKFLEEQQADYLNIKHLNKLAFNDFKRIKRIDSKILFEAWGDYFGQNNDWIIEYKTILSQVDYLEASINGVYGNEKYYSKKSYNTLLEIKHTIDHVSTLLDLHSVQVALQLGDLFKEDEYYKFLILIKNRYRSLVDEAASWDRINEEFLKPLLQNYQDNLPFQSLPEEIIISCKTSRVKLNDVKRELIKSVADIKAVEAKDLKSLQYIKSVNEKLKSLPVIQVEQQKN